MAAIAGLRGTGDWGTDERPKNFRETILWRQPNGQAPLTALLSKMGSESTDDPEFAWWEEQLDAVRVVVDGTGASASSTALGLVSGGNNLVVGDLLLVEPATEVTGTVDNEICRVTAVSSDTAITIARHVVKKVDGTSTSSAIAASVTLMKIGSAYGEGTGAPTASSRNPTKLYNYCQIFKTTYDITETAAKTNARTGNALQNDKKRKMFDHSAAMEQAFLWGRRTEAVDSGNSKPLRYTGGLRSFLSSNVTIYTTTVTEDSFLSAVTPMFNYTSGAGEERLGFMGNTAMNVMNKLAKNATNSRVNFDGIVKVYGMTLQRWVIPQGVLYLKSHPLMNSHPLFTKSAFFIDPSVIKYRYLRDTAFKDNIQGNDEDRKKGQWLTEAGLEVEHEKTMAYLGNMS